MSLYYIQKKKKEYFTFQNVVLFDCKLNQLLKMSSTDICPRSQSAADYVHVS